MNAEYLPLLNANGCYGFSSYADTGFSTVQDIVKHMDRLGVARSLIWYVPSRDFEPLWGNSRMLDDISGDPSTRGRLIPAFTVSPAILYSEDSLKELIVLIEKENICALRLFLSSSGCHRFNLMQFEPLIKMLKDIKPVLFFDIRESHDARDILSFSDCFPDIPMIFTNVLWSDLVNIFDLMSRRENIYLETSWVHTEGTIELAVSRFGSERVIFGMGPKSHNAASISALLHADIGEKERSMIAHGNIERLLGIEADARCISAGFNGVGDYSGNISRIEHRLKSFVKSGIDVIDAHGHLGTGSAYVLEKTKPEEQIPLLLNNMDKLGIKEMIISGFQALFAEPVEGNLTLEKTLTPFKGRFKGYLSFNPFNGDELESRFDSFFKGDFFIGFKLLCDYHHVSLTDKRFEAVWKYANLHRLPILMHTWGGNYNSPSMLKDIVARYPDAIYILGHAGGNNAGRLEAEELAQSNGNVYLEWCGSFCSTIPWEETIKKLGSSHIVFGTDAILHNQAWELGRLLSLDVEDEDLVPILGSNMREILSRRK